MALALSLRTGHDFYVDGIRVAVDEISTTSDFTVIVEGKQYRVSASDWVGVAPGVRLQAGVPRNQSSSKLVVVVIDAPGLPIVRGELFRRETKVSCGTCGSTGKLYESHPCPHCAGFGCGLCVKGTVTESFKCPDCA